MRVFEYQLEVADYQTIEMPAGARVLHVAIQATALGEAPCIWALVNPDAEPVTRVFHTRGTGHELDIPQGEREHLGTYMLAGGAFVGHVFGRRCP